MLFEKIVLPTPDGWPLCDFCSSPNAVWRYPAGDDEKAAAAMVEDKLIMLGSEGDWAACEACSTLIETGDREELLAVTLETYPVDATDIPEEEVITLVENLHASFWNNRKGPRQKIKEGTA